MDAVATVRMSGPLTCHVEGFAAELRAHGYTELSLANQLRLMSDLSRWLESRRCAVDEIDRRIVRRFLARRRRTYTQFTTERALRPLLTYLQGVDAIAVTSAPAQVRSELLQQYERYIVEERGEVELDDRMRAVKALGFEPLILNDRCQIQLDGEEPQQIACSQRTVVAGDRSVIGDHQGDRIWVRRVRKDCNHVEVVRAKIRSAAQ